MDELPKARADILFEREWARAQEYLQGAATGSSRVTDAARESERGRIGRHRVCPHRLRAESLDYA